MKSKTKKKILRIVNQMSEITDAFEKKVRKEHNVACTQGCTACCNLLAQVSLQEALSISLRIGGLSKETLQDLYVAQKVADDVGLDQSKYHAAQIPCAFLKQGSCSIYEHRPGVCRTHFALDTRDHCYDEPGTMVHMLGTLDVSLKLFRHEKEMAELFEARPVLFLPLPHAMLLANARIHDPDSLLRPPLIAICADIIQQKLGIAAEHL